MTPSLHCVYKFLCYSPCGYVLFLLKEVGMKSAKILPFTRKSEVAEYGNFVWYLPGGKAGGARRPALVLDVLKNAESYICTLKLLDARTRICVPLAWCTRVTEDEELAILMYFTHFSTAGMVPV